MFSVAKHVIATDVGNANSTVRVGKYQSDKFLTQNGVKLGDALSPLFSTLCWNTPLGGSKGTRKG
jgi:hypothetical protein